MLADPHIATAIQASSTEFVALEVCDAPEADQFGYEVDGVLISDFVTPRFFQPGMPGPHDHTGAISKPLEIAAGGYLSVWRGAGGWVQITADLVPARGTRAIEPSEFARRARRKGPA